MGLAGQNQVRHMYVGTASASDYADVKSASAGSNVIVIAGADGQDVSAGADFKLFQKDALGNVISSDTIKTDNVLSVRSVAYKAPELKDFEISGITLAANSLYTVNIEIDQHGSLSQEDTYLKQGYYKAVAGDTAEEICNGLKTSLDRNFSRELGATASANPFFTFAVSGSGSSAVLTITGKLQDAKFDANKHIKIVDSFFVDISCETRETVTVTESGGTPGVGTGHQVMEMEYFLLGERGDTYRTMGYPHNIVGPELVSTKDGTYNLVEISYYDEGRDEAKKSKKQLTIAMPFTNLAGNTVSNNLVDDLQTILGATALADFATS